MGYLNKNINPNSIKSLNPQNRLQGDLPKKRINITIDYDFYLLLKSTGNISGKIEELVKNNLDYLNGEEDKTESKLKEKLSNIIGKIDAKESGYKTNSASKLIADLKGLF